MTVLSYPGFVEGQILTRDDLNGLREYLRDRDRSLARLVGFGIGAGLVGEVRSDGLHVSTGLAIDQAGEALLLLTEQVLALPPVADDVPHEPGDVPFADLVDDGPGGFSVVLVRTDAAHPAPACDEDGCSGHSELHDTGVDLLVVPGRLRPGGLSDFADEKLLTAVPLTLTPTGGVSGSSVALRDLVLERVGALLPPATRAKLAGTVIATGDKNAVAAAKAAFLNEVLFAALDLLRVKALLARPPFLEAVRPGVVLGWLRPDGAGWTWDCTYRHDWSPQTGVTLALFGGSCGDPALPWVQRLQSIIDTFVPPTVPDDGKPPVVKPPPFVCRKAKHFFHDDCGIKAYPPVELDPRWTRYWVDLPRPGEDRFVVPTPVLGDEVYHPETPDPVDYGVIDLVGLLGTVAATVTDQLVDLALAAKVTTPNVQMLTAAQATALPGFRFDGVATPADTIVLVTSSGGRVVATGRVPIAQSLKDVGTQLPAVTATANRAADVATSALGQFGVLSQDVHDLRTGFESLDQKFVLADVFEQAEAGRQTWQAAVDGRFAGLGDSIEQSVKAQVASHTLAVSTQLPTLVAQTFEVYQQQVKDATELVSTLAGRNEVALKQLDQLNGRIDVLYRGARSVVGVQDKAVSDQLTDVLKAMRDGVSGAVAPERRDVVEAHLVAVDRGLERLAAVTASGGSALTDSPETLTAVVDALAAGLAETGLPKASLRTVTQQVAALRRTLGG